MTTSDETGPFCHDNYEHPLLWCDEKKRLVERKNAEESLRMWRRRKAEEVARKERDKVEYYDLFVKHCPWGRPGGGAPNVDVRRKDITAVGLHSTPSIVTAHRLNSLQPCRYSEYFAQHKKFHDPLAAYHHLHHHHHAPRITTHKHTVHHVTEPARPGIGSTVTICERGVAGAGGHMGSNGHRAHEPKNGHVDIEVRYKPTVPCKGKPMLEKIVVTENDNCPLNIHGAATLKSPAKKKLAAKMEKPSCKDPWGKPGPGGKPWRSSKAVGSTFMKSLGWTNKEMLKDLDQDNPATPAEKPTFRKSRAPKKLQRCCELCTCTCPAAMSTSPLKPSQKKPSQCFLSKGQNAPKRDTVTQKICPRLVRHCAPRNDGSGGADNHCHNTTDNSANPTTPGGGVELVPLLARRRATNRPISLSSTDVTKRTNSNDRLSTGVDLRYLHDLNTQISQKRRSISMSQQLERDQCNQHFETFDTYWGRPGHGAPSEIKTKLKLDNLLYGAHGHSE